MYSNPDKIPSVRTLLMPPFLAGAALLAVVVSFILYYQYAKFRDQEMLHRRDSAAGLYRLGIFEQQVALGVLLEALQRDEELRTALEEENTEALLELSKESFNRMRPGYMLTRLIFLNSKGEIILRAHAPEKGQIPLSSGHLVREAQRTGAGTGGIAYVAGENRPEVRFIEPVRRKGALLGYIVGAVPLPLPFGKEGDADVDIILFLQKADSRRSNWEAAKDSWNWGKDWDSFSSAVPVYSSFSAARRDIVRAVLERIPAPGQEQEFQLGFSRYLVRTVEAPSFPDGNAGFLLIVENTSDAQIKFFAGLALTFAAAFGAVMLTRFLAAGKLRETDDRIASIVQKLHESELVFQNVFEESETGFILQNWITGEIINANRTALRLFGADKPEDIIISSLTPSNNDDELNLIWRDSGSPTALMTILGPRSVRYCSVEQFFIGTNEEMQCIALRDVTRTLELQYEKKRQIDYLQAIIDHMPCAVSMKDMEQRIALYNVAFKDTFGKPDESLTGKIRYADWLPDNVMDDLLRRERDGLKGGNLFSFEVRLPLRDGEEHLFIVSKRVVTAGSGEKFLLGVGTDITERHHLEQQLVELRKKAESASEAKSRFLACMSHEIRTPMHAVLSMAHLALNASPEPKQRDYLLKIQSAARGLLGIINDILDFSKIEAGAMTLESVSFCMNSLMTELREITSPLVRGKDTELLFEVPLFERNFIGDPLRLRQILLNLVNNALKFTEKGSVVLRCEEMEEAEDRKVLRFTVQDTGIGISEEGRLRLFQSFQQVDAGISRRFGGTGLGLAISSRLAALMGGRLEVESEEGKGSSFFFLVELGKGDIATAVPTFEEDICDFGGRFRVLVAEDNEINREIILDLLAEVNLQAEAVCNGLECVEAVKSRDCDLILMDLQMPVMDGISATKALHRLDKMRERKIPVVALTANALSDDRERCFKAGMDDFLSKPIDVKHLYAKLRQWLPKEAG